MESNNTDNKFITLDYFNKIAGNRIIDSFKKEGVDRAFDTIIEIGSELGIEILIKNENIVNENLPAVFIFNHQSYLDILVNIKLLKKRNAVGVAMKELKYHPYFGDIFDAAGTIFINRENRAESILSLRPAAEGLRNGTSVAIFPEGKISDNRTLGPFKKGAFYLAMYGKVPIIPVVIKNSHDILPKNSQVINPGIIDVTVLEPISITDWTRENMSVKIEEIRQLFIKELNQ